MTVTRKWRDLEARQLTVRSTLSDTGATPVLSEPKTGNSRRLAPIDKAVIGMLRGQKLRQAEVRLRMGPEYQDEGRLGDPRTLVDLDHARHVYPRAPVDAVEATELVAARVFAARPLEVRERFRRI